MRVYLLTINLYSAAEPLKDIFATRNTAISAIKPSGERGDKLGQV
jgi:hypothetical protein